MTVEFYNNSSDNRVLNKSITLLAQNTAVKLMSEENSIINPQIEVAGFNENCNYVKIVEFGRYYYVTDIRPLRGDRSVLSLHVDVLMSHKAELNNCIGFVKRTGSYVNGMQYLVDDRARMRNDNQYFWKNFTTSNGNAQFSGSDYVIAVCGGN